MLSKESRSGAEAITPVLDAKRINKKRFLDHDVLV